LLLDFQIELWAFIQAGLGPLPLTSPSLIAGIERIFYQLVLELGSPYLFASGTASTHDPPSSAFQIARIIGMATMSYISFIF
jgi:hypothetical protein